MRAICLGEVLIDFISTDPVSLMEASAYMRCLGGSAANVAIGLTYQGVQAELISRVGKDVLGKIVLQELKRFGLSTMYVQIDPNRPTKCSFISHDEEGHRYIEIANRQSADQQIDAERMLEAYRDPFELLYVSGVMLLQERGVNLVTQTIQIAKKCKALIAFDPVFNIANAADPVKERIFEVVKHVDILKVNEEEYKAMSSVFHNFVDRPTIIVHTLGANGAFIETHDARVHVDAPKVISIDPTGAGDAFFSTFLAKLLSENSHSLSDYEHWASESAYLAAAGCPNDGGRVFLWA